MKIKNILMTFGLAASVAAMVGGCKDTFLDTPVQGALSSETLSNSEAGVEASLISTYKMLGGFTNTVGNSWGSAPSNYIFNYASDDTHKGSQLSDNADGSHEIALYRWQPGLGVFTHKFQAIYEGVRRANNTIQLANQFKTKGGSDDAVNRITGEAKFLRAWFHFEGYKMWKYIPYYDETDTEFDKPNTDASGNFIDIMPRLIEDLESAESLLGPDKTQAGRVVRSTAQALLGKVKLYNHDYAGAKVAFDNVVNSGKYELVDCFQDLFTVSTQNNSEEIFSYQASVQDGDANGSNSNYLERLAAPHTGSHSGCCGYNNPTQDLVNAYQVDALGLPVANWNATRMTVNNTTPVDPRLDWTVGRTGVPYLDWGLHSDEWIRGLGWAGMYSPKKNMKLTTDANAGGTWNTNQMSAKNVLLIRYADVLLMLAECEVEVGSLERARELVNMVRTRAANCAQGPVGGELTVPINSASITWANYRVGTYLTPFAGQAAAREAVRRERRLELATEGHRLFDLRRWGVLESTITAYRAYETTVTNKVGGQDVTIDELDGAEPVTSKHYVFPLPSTEIDISNGALKQVF